MGFKNLQVMIPFCRTVQEAAEVTRVMAENGLARSADFKIWLMAEIPSNIILADQFNQYVDGYSIGSNDLTMLILGCDRDNWKQFNTFMMNAIWHVAVLFIT